MCQQVSQKPSQNDSCQNKQHENPGAFTFQRNIDAFKGKDKIVLLDVPLDVIAQRLKNDTTRPLLQREDKEEAMR